MSPAEEFLAKMWEAYAEVQCGWQDSMSYHGHSVCERDGLFAAGRVFTEALMADALPEGVKRPDAPEHFESRDPEAQAYYGRSKA